MSKTNKTKDGRHHFKWMKFKGGNVRIDIDIAPLIANMWKLGINTTNSCQADHDLGWRCCPDTKPSSECTQYVWLAFESARDLEVFLNTVSKYTPGPQNENDMYHHINHMWFGRRDDKKDWMIKASCQNYGEQVRFKFSSNKKPTQVIFDGSGKNNFIMQPQLSFPREHLPYVEQKIQEALNKKLKRKKKK